MEHDGKKVTLKPATKNSDPTNLTRFIISTK